MDTRQLALTMQSSEQAIKNQLLHDALHRGGYSAGRLEEAAARAIFYGQGAARSVQRILLCGSDRLPMNGECDIWGNPLTRLTPAWAA